MEQFSLDIWLKDKSHKIVTREGKPVRIVCWDSPNKGFPIVGFIDDNPTVFIWDKYGYALPGHRESNRDLFFADKEKTNKILDELKSYLKNTSKEQVEKDWKEIQDWYNHHFTNEEHNEEEEAVSEFIQKLTFNGNVLPSKDIKGCAKSLLDLARKELMSEISDFEIYDKGFKEGKKYALKDLPKWKKCTKTKNFDNHVILFEDKDRAVLTTEIYEDEYYIELDDLKTLPKEE